MSQILDEEDALELDHKEVDQLLNILQRRLKRFSGDGVVLPWAEGRREALVKDQLPSNFGSGGDCTLR